MSRRRCHAAVIAHIVVVLFARLQIPDFKPPPRPRPTLHRGESPCHNNVNKQNQITMKQLLQQQPKGMPVLHPIRRNAPARAKGNQPNTNSPGGKATKRQSKRETWKPNKVTPAKCPVVLGGARRPVATAVVKNPFVADSSSEESSCGDNNGNFKMPNFLPYLVVPGARSRWAVPGGPFLCFSSPAHLQYTL